MKIQIDTSAKVIRLLETVPMDELLSTLKKLFPNKEWKEFSVQYAGELLWKDVIYVPIYHEPPIYPWYGTSPTITTTSSTSPELVSGIFNVETTDLE